MLTRHLTLLLTLTALSFYVVAQNGGYSLSRSFTVADGLPSNHIYNCMEDSQGFLWITTDAGIARFDGKHFQTFTTKDGLPDDDVLDAVKENNGQMWVSCFKQSPAYFDAVKNRFINAKQDTSLASLGGTRSLYLTALKEGGVMYQNEKGSHLFVNGKITHLFYKSTTAISTTLVQKFDDGSTVMYGTENAKHALFYIKDGKILDRLNIERWLLFYGPKSFIHDNTFYYYDADAGKYFIFSSFKTNPLRCRIDSFSIAEPTYSQRVTGVYITVVSKKGVIYVFDRQSLKLRFTIGGNFSPNNLYTDSKGNIWICSLDKGLFLYKKKNIETFATPDNFTNTYFLSVARKPNGALLAGNFYGQVVETDGKYIIVHPLPPGNESSWQRKIIVLQNKIFSFSEGGTYIDFLNPPKDPVNIRVSSKTAVALNNNIIVEGTLRGLFTINVATGERNWLIKNNKRTTSLAIGPANMIYHGSIDGLYKFDFNKQHDTSLSKKHPLLAERITAVCASPDNYVWVATASNGLLAMHNDTVVKIFSKDDGIISNSVKCINAGRPGEIFIGTNSGVSILRYINTPDRFTYQNLTINDGLSSNIINEMLYSNDTVYCATGNGICAIPANINLPKFDIPVRLTGILINNSDTAVAANYQLKYYQNKIELHFAGIEPGGHFNYFQYRIDEAGWQSLDANTLILQLNSGKHAIAIRALDVNGNAGTKPLLLSFSIATPFWEAVWFWILITLVSGALIVWFLRKRGIAKREVILQAALNQKKMLELELQALKSQINPHFIFNCLNSIKLLNHQHKHAEAEKYLDRFAALLRSALEQSSLQQITLQQEIDFIENYLSLEKLRLPDKLSYSIETSQGIDPSVILIPTMLLQPYIENAIKHGVAPLKSSGGLVQVRFYTKDNSLIAEVEDNGKGINKEVAITKGTGIGMENTARRSRLYNIDTKVIDLSSVEVNLRGTLVQLAMPLQYK